MSVESPKFYPTREENLVAAMQGFMEVLHETRSKNIRPFTWEPIVDKLDHQGNFSPDIAAPPRTGICLPSDTLANYEAAGYGRPVGMDFKFREKLQSAQIGNKRYRHLVFMGELSVLWRNRHETAAVAGNVAIKLFQGEDDVRFAMHEVAVQRYAAERGLPTIETVALISSNDNLYHITEYEQMWTYDKLNWKGLAPEEQDQKIATGLKGLQDMHALKLFHRDAGMRNIATSQRKNGYVIFDCETSGSYAERDLDYFELVSLVSRDLLTFAMSLEEEGCFEAQDYLERYEHYFKRVLLPYRNLALQIPETHPMRLLLLASVDSVAEFWAGKAKNDNLGIKFR